MPSRPGSAPRVGRRLSPRFREGAFLTSETRHRPARPRRRSGRGHGGDIRVSPVGREWKGPVPHRARRPTRSESVLDQLLVPVVVEVGAARAGQCAVDLPESTGSDRESEDLVPGPVVHEVGLYPVVKAEHPDRECRGVRDVEADLERGPRHAEVVGATVDGRPLNIGGNVAVHNPGVTACGAVDCGGGRGRGADAGECGAEDADGGGENGDRALHASPHPYSEPPTN